MKRFRVAYLVSHPIQYQAPMLRYLARQPGLDLEVLFVSDVSVRSYRDPGFGVPVRWDVPLLEGYRHEFLKGVGGKGIPGLFFPLALGLKQTLGRGFDALWVHGYSSLTNVNAILAARRLGLRVLMRGESTLASHPRGAVRQRIKSVVMPRLFSCVDAFLAIGCANAEYYRHYGVAPSRIFHMPYAVDNDFFRSRAAQAASRREELRASLALEPGRPVILYASKFQERKRPADLWEAYRLLSPDGRQEPRPYLVFAGDGARRSSLEAAARATGWGSVRFPGFRNQTELPALFDLCDLFVLPSQHEPWGLVLNEVMNAGRPVVVSDAVGAAADLVTAGETGLVYPVGDIRALADCLRRLTSDAGRCRQMGHAALERISRYDFQADWTGLQSALEMVCA